MAGQPLFAAAPPNAGQQMQARARVVHALNRFTFGPRPGDVAAVETMGLDRWFELQLNPGRIEDSRLEGRLDEYPAARLSIAELEQRFPGPGVIRQMENGKIALPSDPAERTMAIDEIAFYTMQKAKKADAGADGQAAVSGTAGTKNSVQAGLDALHDSGDGPAGAMQPADKPLAASEIAPEAVAGGPIADRFPKERVRALLGQAPEQRYQAVMGMAPGDLVRLRGSLKGPELAGLVAGMTPQQKEILQALPGAIRMVAAEAVETRVLRDVYSERQLEAVMTDFWLNHFNVYVRKNQVEPYLLSSYERETIRPRALGRFEDLLVATAKSPAMLVYLDNYKSIGPDSQAAERVKRVQEMRPNGKLAKAASAGLNENYGRELMELHTLGVNGGYTQADVTAVAKVFTGWTMDKPAQGGSYEFEERRHEPGSKVVLGRTIKDGGEREGLEVLHMLATSPATAHFVCEKLAVRFVSDTPPEALVERMAATFLKKDGDIKEVLRTMYRSPEFWAAGVERAKVKTPEEFVISAVRASGAEVTNPVALVQSLDKLGMPLYGMQTPNGYSWKQDGWVSTGALVSRMNFALVMSAGRLPGVRVDWDELVGGGVKEVAYAADGAAGKERKLESVLLGAPVSERTRKTVLGQAGDGAVAEQAATEFDLSGGKGMKGIGRVGSGGGGTEDPEAGVMAGLLLGSPEFQRR